MYTYFSLLLLLLIAKISFFSYKPVLFCLLVPSSAPDNIIGYNTSSTSLKVQWGDVPQDHRNGIITGYKFEIRKSSGSWQSPVSITDKFYEKTGLAYWTLYDVRVLAETSIGEGAKSEILVVRTDEDSKLSFLFNMPVFRRFILHRRHCKF